VDEIRAVAEDLAQAFGTFKRYSVAAWCASVKADIDDMSFEDKRALVERVFDGTWDDNGVPRRMGVFIEWTNERLPGTNRKAWRYRLRGKLIDVRGGLGLPTIVGDGELQKRLLQEGVKA
jgi:hypothetical protein